MDRRRETNRRRAGGATLHPARRQRFDNNGIQDAKALCLITPAAIVPPYFRESAEVINAAAGDLPDRSKLVEIMRRHGLTPAPPQH